MKAEAEMKRKVELIQQIRALESVPIVRSKFFDMTATSGQGLLCEMSVAEVCDHNIHCVSFTILLSWFIA